MESISNHRLVSQRKFKAVFLRSATAVLALLFFYTAISKLLNMEEFGKQLANQNIPDWSVLPLLWLIPYGELVITFLLIFERTRWMGLYGSAFFMLLFTGYIGLVLLNVFDRIPCNCAGIARSMSFSTHFFFNLFFLIISILAVRLHTSKMQ